MKTTTLFAICASAVVGGCALFVSDNAIVVDAERGAADGDGSRARPYLRPEQARDAIRKMKREGTFPKDGARVELNGVFDYSSSTFEIGKDDGGLSDDARVVYCAGRRGATFTGAKRIPSAAFAPVADAATLARLRPEVRGKVVQCDLRKFGVKKFAKLADLIHAWDGMEFFADGEPRTLARYPNKGWLTFGFDDVVERGVARDRKRGEWEFGVKPGIFRYAEGDARPAAWNVAKGVWLHGFWNNDWASDSLRVGKIDPAKREITTQGIHYLGVGPSSKWKKEPRRYFAYNLLEELDAPGEWYVDREAFVLYYYPVAGERGDYALIDHEAALVRVNGAKFATLEGVRFAENTGCALKVVGGESVTLDGIEVKNVTRLGVMVTGGKNALVKNCRVSNTGGAGMIVTGGDRKTLTKCGHRVTGCDLSRSGRIVSNAACLSVSGCGLRVDHNYVHDAPYITCTYGGNENLIEFNEFAYAMMESGDGGGLYTGRDWTSQGNVVRWNYLHHFGASGAAMKTKLGEPLFCEPLKADDSSGIYLDDCDSGDVVVSNLLFKTGRAFLIGGGRDNLIAGNVGIGCSICFASIDSRGLRRLRLGDGTKDGWDMTEKLKAVNWLNPPWSTAYPLMADYLTNDPLMPVRTAFRDNASLCCGQFFNGGWDKQHEYFVRKMDVAGNVNVGPRGKRDDAIYPVGKEDWSAQCRYGRDAELERLAAEADDARELVKTAAFRRAFPNAPELPLAEIGLRK